MWLLNAISKQLQRFHDERDVPGGYAILSHTWGNDEDHEVLFGEAHLEIAINKIAYIKVEYACRQALQDGLTYVWIDTCCIDKRSSAELTEAINSMYRWYQNAAVCYTLLSDVKLSNVGPDWIYSESAISSFTSARWFTRGWTLQELIAPRKVQFYDCLWTFLGDRKTLVHVLHDITRIDIDVLMDRRLVRNKSVAQRMAWASCRTTTKVEDQAYSLLGIFGVNLPLLYGEGLSAFQRLQEEIIRTGTMSDHSILAWIPFREERRKNTAITIQELSDLHLGPFQDLLAGSPYGFRHAHNIISTSLPQGDTFDLSHQGLRMRLRVQGELPNGLQATTSLEHCEFVTAALECRYADEPKTYITLYLRKRPQVDELGSPRRQCVTQGTAIYDRTYWRSSYLEDRLACVSTPLSPSVRAIDIVLAKSASSFPDHADAVHISLAHDAAISIEPHSLLDWNKQLSILSLTAPDSEHKSHGKMKLRVRSWQLNPQMPAVQVVETMLLADIAARTSASRSAPALKATPEARPIPYFHEALS